MPEPEMKPELFYTIADADSAQARKKATELGLLERLRFRNMAYTEVKSAFATRGGSLVPALWDGVELHQGLKAVVDALLHMSGAHP